MLLLEIHFSCYELHSSNVTCPAVLITIAENKQYWLHKVRLIEISPDTPLYIVEQCNFTCVILYTRVGDLVVYSS